MANFPFPPLLCLKLCILLIPSDSFKLCKQHAQSLLRVRILSVRQFSLGHDAREADGRADMSMQITNHLCSQFATPIPGTTPSTMHLGTKAAAKASHAAAVAAANEPPSEANPYFSATPQKQQQRSVPATPSSRAGRVSNLGKLEEGGSQPGPEQKSRLFSGLKRLMRTKSKV